MGKKANVIAPILLVGFLTSIGSGYVYRAFSDLSSLFWGITGLTLSLFLICSGIFWNFYILGYDISSRSKIYITIIFLFLFWLFFIFLGLQSRLFYIFPPIGAILFAKDFQLRMNIKYNLIIVLAPILSIVSFLFINGENGAVRLDLVIAMWSLSFTTVMPIAALFKNQNQLPKKLSKE